jgi:hypothetical protein
MWHMHKMPLGEIRYPSHSWVVFARESGLEVGATGDAWAEAVRDAWLESGGAEESFEEMFPQFARARKHPMAA